MKPTGFQFKPPAEEMDAAQLIDQETQNTGRSAGRTRGIPVCLRVKHIWPFQTHCSNSLWRRVWAHPRISHAMFVTALIPRYRKSIFLSLAGLLNNASPYQLLSRLQLITCILVGDNAGIGFLVRRVAPSGENEERNEKWSTKLQQSAAFLTAQTYNHMKNCSMAHTNYTKLNERLKKLVHNWQ